MIVCCSLPGVFVRVIARDWGDVQTALQPLPACTHIAIDGVRVGTEFAFGIREEGRIVKMIDVTLDNAVVLDEVHSFTRRGKGATGRKGGEFLFRTLVERSLA